MENHQLKQLAVDAYMFAYPMVLMELTRLQACNVPDANTLPLRAPVNQFAHGRSYPAADAREVVRFNFDTLYSIAWLDLREEPMIVSVPEGDGRYYLTPMYDMWTDIFAVPGTRTTQGAARDFLMAAPGWDGDAPEGTTVVHAPTAAMWIVGRIQTNGPQDYANVHTLQDGYRITPLSKWGQDYTPPSGLPVDPAIDNVTPPLDQVNALDPFEFFGLFAQLLKSQPAHPNDFPILHRMEALGFTPGQDFTADSLSAEVREAIAASLDAALADLVSIVVSGSVGIVKNGWNWDQEFGTYGTNYRLRAMVAMAGLGANLADDAIYPNAITDADGNPFTGENNYVLHFSHDNLPSVDAFWSLTMYDDVGFQIPNILDRFAIGDRDPLEYNHDGSLDLYIQTVSPGPEKESNWLPAPQGSFAPMLRLYSPTAGTLRGEFVPPAVVKVS
ncbi:hypothetical protein JOF48_003170 [Arthrobacter stackebrandtii]|uniref:DUF1254 domain-containing protein n=1 Tax=Arthrobacter stackebrandtii TaxID=272161 RepID=A0ABS4YZZ1_9MICC|nr:DUF1254 domain-containing protein [Arthrobacter stackebrandtii]MBP2414371.1 hypothetical protein [Arthrobacter stackebrandtii]PYH01511.1 hypothetical protein CVV67_03250 [Arthrobacter stackebrandtii]